MPDRGERYQVLHDALQKVQLPFMADFHYVPEGLRVKGAPYPAVVMEWGRGIQLDKAIEYDLADDGILQCAPFLAGELFFVVKTLQKRGMGHNDLQEGNILVRDDNKLVLIDYDGMFAPQLKNWPPCEMGLPNFQHPLRDKTHFNAKIDDFALITILYQLAIITPERWRKFHDDRRLLLKANDYKHPDQSELIQYGLKSEEPHVRALAQLLAEACSRDPLGFQAIEKVEASPEIMNWLAIPGEPVSESQAESAIQWALALQTDDVDKFEKNQLPGPDYKAAEIKAVKHRKADAGRWKALREYLEAGKAMRQAKAADVRQKTPIQSKTAPRPYARPISSGAKPSPKPSPAPSTSPKSSFGTALATFITLLFKLAWKYVKTSNVRIAVAIGLIVALPFCMYQFLKPESAPVVSTPKTKPAKKKSITQKQSKVHLIQTDKPSRSSKASGSRVLSAPAPIERFIAKGEVVIDNRTGLMWAARDYGRGIQWFDAQKYCQNYRGGGYTDWRMPKLPELESLFDKEAIGYLTKEKGHRQYMVYLTPLIKLSRIWVWTDKTKSDGSRVAYFNLNSGLWYWFTPDQPGGTALPVRILKPDDPPPLERFIAKGLVVIDNRTGLMWAAIDNGTDINWFNAKKYCQNYRGGGYTDWRMPKLPELESLYDRQTEGYRIKSNAASHVYHVFLSPLIKLTGPLVWAQETNKDGSLAAPFNFYDGDRYWSRPRVSGVRALPVRVAN